MSIFVTPPELLAPAGDWQALRAAVANGADAVYFGLSEFNARHRAHNFTLEELPPVMQFLHERRVRGYVTLNTLIFADELPKAARLVEGIAAAGADAVIVQDLGLAALIHRLAPTLPIHGSTQMTLTEPAGIEWVRGLGVDRVILARELSLDDIQAIRQATSVPVEVFVHGALCVAYSGQCLTSEALGGRSANRGQCAQACRLPYELVVDGVARDLGDKAYLLSPKDLAAHDLVGDLARLGVVSLKIEGRLKSAEYVAMTTGVYRRAIDACESSEPFALNREQQLDLAQSFSRGFSHGFLAGIDHQELVEGRFPKSRGVRIGTVVAKTRAGAVVRLDDDQVAVRPGDGLVFDEGHPEQDEQGGRAYEVNEQPSEPQQPRRVELVFGRGSVNWNAVSIGALLWKTDDPALRRRLERTYASDRPLRRGVIGLRVWGAPGEPLFVSGEDDRGRRAVVSWPGPLQAARKHPLDEALAREQLGRLGDTRYELGSVELELPQPVMAPKSVLNDLRRQLVMELEQQQQPARHAIAQPDALRQWRRKIEDQPRAEEAASQLAVLVRNEQQLSAVLQWRPDGGLPRPAIVYCDYEDVRRYRDAVRQARDHEMPVGLATLRIIKPGEAGLLRHIVRAEGDTVLVRNLAALALFRAEAPQCALVGDYALNVANDLTADLLLEAGLARITPSYDMNWNQFEAFARRTPAWRLEAVVHQHLPMFHMEHCVFAAVLSSGKDWRDCGRPCDHHRVELRDRAGAPLPLLADTGCRNTVFNAVAQSAAEYLPSMQRLGLRYFRVELLRETRDETCALLQHYTRVLAGLDSGRGAWRQLQVLNQLGVTRGTMQLA